MKNLLSAGALALALAMIAPATAMATEYKAGGITIVDPWARATAGLARNGGAFMTIKSGGGEDELLKIETEAAKRAELHTHKHENGVMKMRKVDGIKVPAGGMVQMRPGGLHVMLMKLSQPLKTGERFPMTLHFAKAGKVTVQVDVMGMGSMGAGRNPAHGGHDSQGKMKMKTQQ